MKKNALLRLLSMLLIAAFFAVFADGCVVIGDRKPICTLKFSNGGEVRIRLYPDQCPNTVNNFIKLCNSGFYDGSPVHRIVEYVLVQMGMPAEGGESDAGYYIKGEFSANGHSRCNLTFNKGVVGMARLSNEENSREYYNTASSQFFIMLETKPPMDGYYAAFGKVITGIDVITAISKMDTDEADYPRDEIYIVSASVDCYDYKPSEPKTLDKASVKLY